MAEIRQATMFDISAIQACDLLCFPDEDPWDYFLYEEYIVFWPRLVYVAEDSVTGCIVGYVFAQVDGEGTENHGYIANLCVVPTHRKQGIAKELMDASQNALVQEYGSEYVSLHIRTSIAAKLMTAAQNALVQEYGCDCVYLHVRQSNYAAIDLYIKILGYIFHDTIAKFYVDGEDAYVMRKQLPGKQPDHLVLGFSHGGGCFWSKANAELLGLLDRLEIC
ncbi:N-terminal acetyltransferase A complex catalytic subunit NAA10-like [Papaver somniferum]|uniref:N-terminal acetyltransferase A complex catalytic subunit NAA10-like n=1 Tax=Papaver somniferum TaxID=3469 RepID=UPI000E704AA4|nr:N-terminal acetyltransferase A complex catalytic subunit NAA10-like [Papaver somniferum]